MTTSAMGGNNNNDISCKMFNVKCQLIKFRACHDSRFEYEIGVGDGDGGGDGDGVGPGDLYN